MGLYSASCHEISEQIHQSRSARLQSSNVFARIWYNLKYKISDYVIDPIITFTRCVELACIFLPLLLSYPICLYDRKRQTGAKLWYRYIRWSAEIAGASFIKLGQWAATRADILPKGMCEELNNLHSNSKAHSFHQTKKIVSASFGNHSFEEIFEEFNETPVGVGAIAQVYLAKINQKFIKEVTDDEEKIASQLKFNKNPDNQSRYKSILEKFIIQDDPLKSNQQVAIKVLHPNVEVKIRRDLKLMRFFANFINAIPTMEWLSLPDEVDQFEILMRLQLDLRIEGYNLAKFRYNFKDKPDIHFPKPYLSFTSRCVLVEEYMHAIPLEKLLSIHKNFGQNLSKEVSDKGLDSFLQMLILDNFIHADLHPGNMMVRFYKNTHYQHKKEYKIIKSSNESETNKITEEFLNLPDDQDLWCEKLHDLYHQGYHAEICFLDVGIVTELNQVDRVNFIDLFKALSDFDGYKAGELMIERSRTPDSAIDTELFAMKVEKLVDRMKQRTFALGNLSIGDLLEQVMTMVRKHHVRMEGDFISILVAILLLEGIGRQLDPGLDLFARFVYAMIFDYDVENY
ncbi:ABC1-domain-containing protein [Yamadazyma tenuis ATCC 10573]|uniref:ABC1-domain-containing protein n=1 Tax=Candida tenuis (strain ATCC 10573 / BCRC 21748 / CBS 615 / JCM 9827 / NBRC 10315 / NRRL Y-1498 / VKM Y-70) TaxID=590646 RepID=G3B6B1_CANTC|nr:ABC1-domain-containing protein [Yamadazyma tenuis ATCC 10573]EGV63428.1 ABC1-domain-containing protein [Yamadazyma tenuis ATCC 10573]